MSDPKQEPEEFMRARRGRNIALALALAVFVILVFVVTIINMKGSVLDRPF